MSEFAIKTRSVIADIGTGRAWISGTGGPAIPSGRLVALAVIAIGLTFYAVADPGAADAIKTALSEAYLQVSVFVAATLALFYGLERWFAVDTAALLSRYSRWQVPMAALLGALPGCGGAILVVTQYVQGRLSFGAVLAVLTATMGDAAFLLLAREPLTGLAIFALGFGVGIATGYVVDAVHGRDFLRHTASARTTCAGGPAARRPVLDRAWTALMVPGVVLGGLGAFQIDTDALLANPWIAEPATLMGVIGAVLCVGMWAAESGAAPGQSDCQGQDAGSISAGVRARTIDDTNFVTSWVVLAFLLFEIGVHASGVDLKGLFAAWAPMVPLLAVALGFLPGCGPAVMLTALYLGGAVPLSAQIGNAISNDGDALFPAIAMAPRAAVLATLYSAVPALIVAYGWFFFMEM